MANKKAVIMLKKAEGKKYDCLKCPSFCCSYPLLQVSASDIKRLAEWFSITVAEFKRRCTWYSRGEKSHCLKQREDPHFGAICMFVDPQTRGCRVYEARPKHCRTYPNGPRCGYYDFLTFERWHHADPDTIAYTDL